MALFSSNVPPAQSQRQGPCDLVARAWVNLSKGSGFESESSFQTFECFSDTQRWLTGDFNGDGKDDLINVYRGPDNKATAWVHLSTGSGFESKSSFQRFAGFWDTQRWLTRDFNGDGKDDLVNVYGALPNPPQAPENLRAQVDGRTITLSWRDDSNNEDGFKITWRGEKTAYVPHRGSASVGTNKESYTIRGKEGYKYCVNVQSYNQGGESSAPQVCNLVIADIADPAPSPTQGYSQAALFNCNNQRRTVYFWIRDITANSRWSEKGSLPAQYSSSGSCPATDASPLVIPLTGNHLHEIVIVDPDNISCGGRNDPLYGPCRKFQFQQPIRGDTDGPTLPVIVN